MATTNTEVGHSDAGATAPFPPFQSETFASQLLWLAITFGLFYYLMSKIALPRISSILEVRSDRIEQNLDEANRLRTESDEALASYEHDLALARTNAQSIAQTARDESKMQADARRAVAEEALTAQLAKSEANIAATKASAMAEVGAIAEQTTAALVEQLIGRAPTKAEITAAVSQATAR